VGTGQVIAPALAATQFRWTPYLEEERKTLCGPLYQHDPQRTALRAGSVRSSLSLGGRRVEVERPRARSIDGRELSLASWRAWSARDPLERRAIEQIPVGVSTRRYARWLEALPSELKVRDIGKSMTSERFLLGTARKLATLMQHKLGGLQLIAVMIDGVRFADHVVLAAIGIDTSGNKRVLGLREWKGMLRHPVALYHSHNISSSWSSRSIDSCINNVLA